MRIALVHDFLNHFGGAERVVAALHELYPEAPLYTSIYNKKNFPEVFSQIDIKTSNMQYLPFIFKLFRIYFLLYPLAFESFDLSAYNVILSSSSAFAKGVKKLPGQLHICYCHTPMRFVWRYQDYIKNETFPNWVKDLLPFFLEPLEKWDRQTAEQVDYFIANSQTVANRIRMIYHRESDIINPPVNCGFFKPGQSDSDYFLIVSRLNAYKRIDLAIEVANQLGLPLKIIGRGPDAARLKRLAKDNIEFLGQLSDEEVAKCLAECRALIFPGEEDFGIVPLEAMSAGRPVIAFAAGGAKETIVDGQTGLFFEEATTASLTQAVKRFQFEVFNKKEIRQQALKYDRTVFKDKLKEYVKRRYEEKYGQS